MAKKINIGYLLLGAIVLFIIVATFTNSDVSGSLTYARKVGTTMCVDSDWGRDYTTPGYVIDGTGRKLSDWCRDTSALVEYYCSDNGEVVKENYACQGDYSCLNGACVIGAAVCYDSDNRRNYFIKGTASAAGESHTDYCYDSDTVVEYYCSPLNEVKDAMSNCAYGCSDGACISG